MVDEDTPEIDVEEAVARIDAVASETVVAEIEGKDWSKGAVIVVSGTIPSLPKGDKRPIVIVEAWSDPKFDEKGELTELPKRKEGSYPASGDLYYRTVEETNFGAHGPVITLGREVQQAALWGFAERPGMVNVGPGMPAWSAANIAWQNGALDIEIYGLTARQKELLQPFVDDLKKRELKTRDESAHAPARPDVTITLK